MDEEILNRIKVRLRYSRNYGKIARDMSLSVREVEAVDVEHNGRFNYTPEGLGQPEMLRHMIARYDIREQSEWDNSDPKIIQAREDYDAGKIEMATGRDGFFMLLYAIPRKTPADRPLYFSAPPEEF